MVRFRVHHCDASLQGMQADLNTAIHRALTTVLGGSDLPLVILFGLDCEYFVYGMLSS